MIKKIRPETPGTHTSPALDYLNSVAPHPTSLPHVLFLGFTTPASQEEACKEVFLCNNLKGQSVPFKFFFEA
jgi:hypothetical protein